jgi:hypothetical protein
MPPATLSASSATGSPDGCCPPGVIRSTTAFETFQTDHARST